MIIPSSFVRTAHAAVGKSILALGLLSGLAATARAQAYNPGTDPFVQRLVNHGEQQMSQNAFSGNRFYYDYPESPFFYRFLFNQPLKDILRSSAFFPPQPPALAEKLSATNAVVPRPASWLTRADYPGETFYMAYAGLLRQGRLSAKRTQRIAEYNATRRRLVDDLQAKFEELKDAPAQDRASALAQFATHQDTPLQALEAEAEAIRHDLTSGGLFTASDTGQDLDLLVSDPLFHLNEAARDFIALLEAAQYSDGFSTDQRFLLREMAFEARAGSANAEDLEKPSPAPYLYFLPATARIHLPENLPPALAAKAQAFTAEKNRLKDELRTAVYRKGVFTTRRQRAQQFAQLAEQQAPRFAALEILAEEIRSGFAELPYPDKPDRSTLSEDLTRRVGTFGVRKAETQRELFQHLRAFSVETPGARFKIVRQGDGLAIAPTEPAAATPAKLAAVNADLATRYTALAHEADSLRRDIQRLTEADPQQGARTVDQLAADFGRAYSAQENWNRYRDYTRAVLEPGLSPAQRRLLFAVTLSDFFHAGYLSSP